MPIKSTGKPVGAPRVHDRAAIAKSMIEWAKREDSLNLNGFCCEMGIVPQKISQWALEEEEFREAYNLAKSYLGARREQKLCRGQLHVKAYDLNSTVYDYFLKEEKLHILKFQADLAKAMETEDSEELKTIKSQFDSLMSQLKKRQSLALNKEEISTSAE